MSKTTASLGIVRLSLRKLSEAEDRDLPKPVLAFTFHKHLMSETTYWSTTRPSSVVEDIGIEVICVPQDLVSRFGVELFPCSKSCTIVSKSKTTSLRSMDLPAVPKLKTNIFRSSELVSALHKHLN